MRVSVYCIVGSVVCFGSVGFLFCESRLFFVLFFSTDPLRSLLFGCLSASTLILQTFKNPSFFLNAFLFYP